MDPVPEDLLAPAAANVSPGAVRSSRSQLTEGEDVVDPTTWAGSVPKLPASPRVRIGRRRWFNLLGHGAPLRLRNEIELGFKQVKWIKGIEFVAHYSEIGGGHGGYNQTPSSSGAGSPFEHPRLAHSEHVSHDLGTRRRSRPLTWSAAPG